VERALTGCPDLVDGQAHVLHAAVLVAVLVLVPAEAVVVPHVLGLHVADEDLVALVQVDDLHQEYLEAHLF